MHTGRLPLLLALGCLVPGPAHANKKCPNVMFILDQSGSMAEDPNGGINHPNKWELLQMAVSASLAKYGQRLSFGMEMFTSSGQGMQCYTDTMINVQPAHGTAAQINMILGKAKPLGGTNTGEAIKRAYNDSPPLKDASRGEYLVLITDGDPNCNGGDLGGKATYTIGEITAAAMQKPSIHTFVVGFDGAGGVNPANLNNMAIAGLEPIANCDPQKNMPCYYSASTTQKFLAAVDKIIGGIAGGTMLGGCDDSCFANPCPNGQICIIPKGQTYPACAGDPCLNVMCPDGTYCKQGQCLMPCPPCADSERCANEACINWPCKGVMCPMGQTCDPKMNKCTTDLCVMNPISCPPPLACDPLSGNCADDPCRLVSCPGRSSCHDGFCESDPVRPMPDLAMSDDAEFIFDEPDMAQRHVTGHPQGGCDLGGGGDARGVLTGILLVAGLLLRRRKSR